MISRQDQIAVQPQTEQGEQSRTENVVTLSFSSFLSRVSSDKIGSSFGPDQQWINMAPRRCNVLVVHELYRYWKDESSPKCILPLHSLLWHLRLFFLEHIARYLGFLACRFGSYVEKRAERKTFANWSHCS